MDGHSGDPYRYGDDEDLDRLLDRRWALALDHIQGDTHEAYEDGVAEVTAWIKSEQEALTILSVTKRITTRRRQARGWREEMRL